MSEKGLPIIVGMHICQDCGGPVAAGGCQNKDCPPSLDYAAIVRTLLAENTSLKAEVERLKAEKEQGHGICGRCRSEILELRSHVSKLMSRLAAQEQEQVWKRLHDVLKAELERVTGERDGPSHVPQREKEMDWRKYPCKCVLCSYQWIGLLPDGRHEGLECPQCKRMMGRAKLPDCPKCGCDEVVKVVP